MKNYLLIFLFVIVFKVNSQIIKVYNGNYKKGVAKYQYFENKDYERIFDGDFYYTRENITTVKGSYKNNKKIGDWTYINNFKDSKKIIKTEGRYLNDKKNGLWTYSKNQLDDKSKSYSVTLNFHNDTIVGKIDIPNLKGEFNNTGQFIGIWNLKKDNREFIAEFKDNIIIKLIDRQISDGSINSKYIPVLDSIKFNEIRLKSSNHKYKAQPFSTKYDSIFSSSFDFFGVKKDSNYNMLLTSFDLFIKEVNSLFNDFDNQIENDFDNLNHITIINPEIIVIKSIPEDLQTLNNHKPDDALSNILHGNKKGQIEENNDVGGNGNVLEIANGYSLTGRKALNKPKPTYNCNEEGVVVVQITVDKNGNVIDAKPGARGTTNEADCLLNQAKIAAMNTKWTTNIGGTEKQVGFIKYNFSNRLEQIENDKDLNNTLLDSNKNNIDKIENIELFNSAGVEVKPEFPGGIAKFYNFIKNNYQMPNEPGLEGQVFVSFIVEEDGSLTDIKVLRDIGFGTGKEAIRVMNKCPKWIPAEQNGKKVRCSYQIPIKINSSKR